MKKLINCLNCGVVINTKKFILTHNYNLSRLKEDTELQNDDMLKEEIYYNWVDIEQTEEEYLKFCPVCKKWEYHKEV